MFEKEGKNISLQGVLKPADVLLAVSPLTETIIPGLGIHLLQASCRCAGINTGVLYSNLLYANLIGRDIHKSIVDDGHLLLGERIFASAAFNLSSVSIGRTIRKFSDPAWAPDHVWQVNQHLKDPQVPGPVVSFRDWLGSVDLDHLESLTVDWLSALARQIVKIGFRIVGCSTTLGGLVPAVALLNCVKKINPDITTVIGGALCETGMAEGILSLNTNIDYIFSGEGEVTFPTLVKKILENRLPKEKIIYGQEVVDLDTIPLPDYQDYMAQRVMFPGPGSPGKNDFALPFETSRGCWYGKCTFCGLNREMNVYRTKSPDTVIQSLKALVERHDTNLVYMCDTMMPFQYFDTLLPRLPIEIPFIKIFYELSARLTLAQVLSLKQAGVVEMLPGIESLSPSLLRRMHKPCSVRENIATLRYARSVGISVEWNLLFGFPGDQTSEYEEMLHLFPLLRHLKPPRMMLPLRLFRFSRYQVSPEKFGLSNLLPGEIYKDILPPYADLHKIANLYAAEFPSQSRENPTVIAALWEEYQDWRKAWADYEMIPLDTLLPSLQVSRKASDRYVLEDTRGLPGKPKRIEINRDQASLLLVACPLDAAPDIDWVLDAGLGVVMESWFIPLATAEPKLLQEFEGDFQQTI